MTCNFTCMLMTDYQPRGKKNLANVIAIYG